MLVAPAARFKPKRRILRVDNDFPEIKLPGLTKGDATAVLARLFRSLERM